VTTSTHKELIKGYRPIDGPIEIGGSTRSELGGFTAPLLLVTILARHWGLRHRCKFRWLADSEVAINRVTFVTRKNHSPTKQPDNSDYLTTIKELFRELRRPMTTQWIKSHQDGNRYFASPSAWIFEKHGIILYPTAFKAVASDPDTLSFDQAMADIEHVTKWMEAAAKEVASSLEKNGTWKEVSMLKAKTKVLPGTWVFWRRRSPDGEITKYKARYCVRGDLEEG
jgi:hypothetical protein